VRTNRRYRSVKLAKASAMPSTNDPVTHHPDIPTRSTQWRLTDRHTIPPSSLKSQAVSRKRDFLKLGAPESVAFKPGQPAARRKHLLPAQQNPAGAATLRILRARHPPESMFNLSHPRPVSLHSRTATAQRSADRRKRDSASAVATQPTHRAATTTRNNQHTQTRASVMPHRAKPELDGRE
jgi:hypothetical protein